MDELLNHAHFVRGLARSLVLDENRADDAVQQTWLAALRSRPDGRRPLRPWLAAVLRNAVRRGHRSDGRRARHERAAARSESAPSIPDTLAREEMLQRVVEAVLGLEERYRLAVLLHYYEGLSYAEVAQRLGVSVETVRSRLKRARLQLRAQLDHSHPGGRRAWMPALAALAGLDRGALAGLATTGGVVMGIKAKLAVASLVAVVLVTALWQVSSDSGDGAVSRTPREITDAPAEPPPMEGAASPAPGAATGVAVEHYVRGHVRDASGNPVEGAPVFVGAKKDPFGDRNPFHVQPGDYYGRVLHTDANGAFRVRFDGPQTVYVWHYSSGHIRPEWKPGRWVETPADGVDFTSHLLPTATLVVRVNDLAEGRPVKRFECHAAVRGRGGQRIRTEDFVAEHRLVLPEAAAD
ncbi:MAG: sigma-70 family RNA polymerase sigma factor, partial [Planctomycetota bacterium]